MRITNKKQLQVFADKGLLSAHQQKSLTEVLTTKKRSAGEQSRICAIKPIRPAYRLYQRLVRQYGRHVSGGEMVFELCFKPLGRRWRLDMALPKFKLGIELDGWANHGRMRESFLRDREKSLWFERRGWRVVRFSANQIMDDIDEVCLAISEIIAHCKLNEDDFEIVQVSFDRSEYNVRL